MLLLLRGARAASAASTAVDAGAGRSISIRLTAVAALSSGGRRRKGQRRGVAKPPSPSPPPPPPPPQPLPRHGETPSSNKKSGARTSVEAKKSHPAEMERARGPQSPERGEERKGRTPPPQQLQEKAKAKRQVRWKCASGCGACCKLDKGPDFPTPDEIFADHPDYLQVGPSTTLAFFSIREQRECFLIKDARFRSIRAWNLLLCISGATDGDDVGHACSCTGA